MLHGERLRWRDKANLHAQLQWKKRCRERNDKQSLCLQRHDCPWTVRIRSLLGICAQRPRHGFTRFVIFRLEPQ